MDITTIFESVKRIGLSIFYKLRFFITGEATPDVSVSDASGSRPKSQTQKINTLDPMASARLPVDLNKLTYVNKISSYQYGQPCMLECFATWCGPCRAAIPHLATIPKKYPSVYMVAVSQEDVGTVKTFAAGNPDMKKYNVAVDSSHEVQGLMSREGARGIPHCFIFDGSGKMVWQGNPTDSACDSILSRLNAASKASSGAGASGFTGKSRRL